MTLFSVLVGCCGMFASSGPTQLYEWASPKSGQWNFANNWSPASIPSGFDSFAALGWTTPYVVFVDSDVTIGGLAIDNPEAELRIASDATLELDDGGIANTGVIFLSSLVAGRPSTLDFIEPSAITGTGTIRLAGSGPRARIISSGLATVTNGVEHTIAGYGQLPVELRNHGTIRGDDPNGRLTLIGKPKFNSGTIVAVGNGSVELALTSVVQEHGVIEARGGEVFISGSTVVGGSLVAGPEAGSSLRLGNTTLNGVTIEGLVGTDAGSTVVIGPDGMHTVGTFIVNRQGDDIITRLITPVGTELTGEGAVRLNGGLLSFEVPKAEEVLVSAEHSIVGHGAIDGALRNAGKIQADTAGEILRMAERDIPIINEGSLMASNGGTLAIGGDVTGSVQIEQSDGGQIVADGGTVELTWCLLQGGSLSTLETVGSRGVLGLNLILQDVSLTGNWEVPRSAIVRGTILNDGAILVNPSGGASFDGRVVTDEDTALSGAGVIRLNAPGDQALIRANQGASLEHGEAHKIRGFGQVLGAWNNLGRIEADVAGETLELDSAIKLNSGVLSATEGGILLLSDTIVDQAAGGLTQADGGTVHCSGALIDQGLVRNSGANGSAFEVSSGTFDAVTVIGAIDVLSGGTLQLRGPIVQENSTIELQSGSSAPTSLVVSGAVAIDGVGAIALQGGAGGSRITGTSGSGLAMGPNQVLRGSGDVDVPLSLSGVLQPGPDVSQITFRKPLTLTDTAEYRVEIDETGESDRIESIDAIHVAGSLRLDALNAATMTFPSIFEITSSSAGVTGRFGAVESVELPHPVVTRVAYGETSIIVGFVCPGDVDVDGQVGMKDLNAILSVFGSADPDADIDGNGLVDLGDLNIVLASYGSGC